MGIVFPCHASTAVRVDGNFHGFGDYLCSWRLFVLDTHTKTSLFGHLRVKADQLAQGEGYGRVIDSSEGQGHMSYMEIHMLLKVKVGHLTALVQSFVSFILISTLHAATPNLC